MVSILLHLQQAEDHLCKFQNSPYLTLLLIVLWLYLIKQHVIRRPRLKLSPGPLGLPVIGNLHQLGYLPHRSFALLAEKYGPLMYLRLGQMPTLVVSSAGMAKEVLKTNDLAFCSRPPFIALRKISYGGLDVAFTPYSEYWRQVRRISMLELLSTKRVQFFRTIREEEVGFLVRTISKHSSSGPVNLSDMLLCLLNNITCRAVFGEKFSEGGDCWRSKFHELVEEYIVLGGGFCAGDFFPSMEWLNVLTGLKARLEKNFLEMDAFLEEVIEERCHNNHLELEHNDFASVLLQLQKESAHGIPLSKDHIKAILMNMFIAGTDTTATSIEWGMTELMKNPRVMKRAQDEIRSVIGNKEKVEESDLHKLEYLKLIVKEIFRFHPSLPLLLPRECREDCRINGYDIPMGTRVYINVWAIGRDPNSWENPNEFLPERFNHSPIDYKGQNFELLPFGAVEGDVRGLLWEL